MTRTIDAASLEAAIVRHCSPTLAGLKPASLFTFPGAFTDADPGSDERRRALLRALEGCRDQIGATGMSIRVLSWRTCGALVYVYRPRALTRYLADPCVQARLAREGYDAQDMEACLERLATRLDALDGARKRAGKARPCPCPETSCKREFPHEMGFFLGYPPEDVIGFIEHEGRNYLAVGPWKVYAHLDRALETFERWHRCQVTYARAQRRGARLATLAVSLP